MPSVRLDTKGTKGLGIGIGYERDHAVVAQTIKGSPAEAIPLGQRGQGGQRCCGGVMG